MISTWEQTFKAYCINHGDQKVVADHLLYGYRIPMPVCINCAQDHERMGDRVEPMV